VADRGLLLSHVTTRGARGFELGALMSPFVDKAQSDVLLVDRLSTEALRQQYAGDANVDPARIAPVDVVIGEDLFASLAPHVGDGFDYAIASHVIEHVPDLVTWLGDIARLLRPGGRLLLVVPDKRYTFDLLRDETGAAEVIDAYVRRAVRPSPRQVFDFQSLAVEVDKRAAWAGALQPTALRRFVGPHKALRGAQASFRDGIYVDCHCWVFTPGSFLRLCMALADLGLLPFRLAFFCATRRDDEDFGLVLERAPENAICAESFAAALAALQGA
jgi:SAM-dependent methyltransferase